MNEIVRNDRSYYVWSSVAQHHTRNSRENGFSFLVSIPKIVEITFLLLVCTFMKHSGTLCHFEEL